MRSETSRLELWNYLFRCRIYLFERQNIYIYKSAGSIPTNATALLIWSREQGGMGVR